MTANFYKLQWVLQKSLIWRDFVKMANKGTSKFPLFDQFSRKMRYPLFGAPLVKRKSVGQKSVFLIYSQGSQMDFFRVPHAKSPVFGF